MWITKSKWAGAAMLLVVICFMFADCAKEEAGPLPDGQEAAEAEIVSEEMKAGAAETALEQKTEAAVKTETSAFPLQAADEGKPGQTDTVKAAEKPEPEQTAAAPSVPSQSPVSAPAPAPVEQPKKYSVVGPDGVTYTGFEPMFIICRCGEKFASGTEWQAHRDYHSAFRCSCGSAFTGIGEWEAHAGIYDPSTFMYTGKTREEASNEGHSLTNEASHTEEYNAHNGWHTTGFPG